MLDVQRSLKVFSSLVIGVGGVLSTHLASAQTTPVVTDLFRVGSPVITHNQHVEKEVRPALTALVRELSPSVVNISVEGSNDEAHQQDDKNKQDDSGGLPSHSSGSGFIIHEDGLIVTSNHVIDRSSEVVVRLLDDRTDYVAKVIGKDPKTDIALLSISAGRKLPSVFIGDSDTLEVGEDVIAIGNQFQLGQTVTAGIVSAKSRRVPNGSSGPYDAFIQTDASINPGSSGGPLFNRAGQVVGINTAIFSPGRAQFGGTGFNIGIGFAIPINMARTVLTQLRESGKVTRGLLGVLIQRVDSDITKVLNLDRAEGALVSEVVKNTPASASGFKRQDVIVSFNGVAIRDHEELPALVANTKVGSRISVEYIRSGSREKVDVVITELKGSPPKETKGSEEKIDPTKPDALGLVVESLSPEMATVLNIEPVHGVSVVSVVAGSLADRAGLLRGDVIEEVASRQIKGGDDFREYVKREFGEPSDEANLKSTTEKRYLVLVRRKEGVRFVVIKRSPIKVKPKGSEASSEENMIENETE